MTIQWYGQSCFKLQNTKLTIFIDPFSEEIGLKPPKGKADIVLVTHNHYDHNNVTCFENKPFIIKGAGEYEVKGIEVRGMNSWHDDREGATRGNNTIFTILMDDLKICHLGDLGQPELEDEQVEAIGKADILMIPVGGLFTLDAAQASQVISQIEPSIVIPMHYKIPGLKIDLEGPERFAKEIGAEIKPVKEFKIKQEQLPTEMEVIFLTP